jgi:hypothetical protein
MSHHTPKLRKHQPIWEQLKLKLSASVAAEPKFHARIIKAVINEKYEDIGWKCLCSEQELKYKLQYTSDNNLVAFKLIDISHTLPINLNNL